MSFIPPDTEANPEQEEFTPDETMASNNKEIQINTPTEFDGNRDNLNSFLQDCQLYITLDKDVYNTDTKKIVFMLSYMTKATAKAWKEAYVHNVLATPTANFGTFENFITDLQKAFSAADTEGDARANLQQLHQGNRTVDEYVAQFRILAGRARITDDTALIEYFMEGLNVGILQKIFAQPTIPKTIGEWYKQASKYDAQYRRVREILNR